MIWIENAYVTVFDARRNDRGYFQGRGSTSEKMERNGQTEYRNSYWNLRATRSTEDDLIKLNNPRGVRIKVTKGKVDNVVFKDREGKSRDYPTLTILAFEPLDRSQKKVEHHIDKSDKPQESNNSMVPIEDDEDLPF